MQAYLALSVALLYVLALAYRYAGNRLYSTKSSGVFLFSILNSPKIMYNVLNVLNVLQMKQPSSLIQWQMRSENGKWQVKVQLG